MKQGSQKSKGNAFENKVAKDLSSWLTDGSREDVLIRSQNSGGRATVLNYAGKNFVSQAGDITAVDQEGFTLMDTFIIECKHHKNLYLDSLLFNSRKDGIIAHWKKLLKECETFSRSPMYIARQNGKPILVAFDSFGVNFFNLKQHLTASFHQIDLYIVHFDTFINYSDKSNLTSGITDVNQVQIKPRI